MSDPAFVNKKKIRIFTTESECPLRLSQLIIYSYLAYQDQYDNFPSIRSLCKATGLGYDSCRAAVAALEGHGLVNGTLVKPPPADWFKAIRAENIKAGSHYSTHFATWTYYVRAPRGSLTHAAVAVYSFLRHCRVTGYMPKEGWTKAYFAKVLRCKRDTIIVALTNLQQAGFLSFDDQLHIKLYKLTADQMRCFSDKATKPERKPKIEFVDSPAPQAESSGTEASERPSYLLRLVCLFNKHVSWSNSERLAGQIRDNTDWDEFDSIYYFWIKDKLEATEPAETAQWITRIAELAVAGELESVMCEDLKAQDG